MSALAKYDAACRALAEARSVDEAKNIRDRAVAMRAYAKQAKNRDLEADAVEIRMRATRRLDQLRQAQKQSVGLNAGAKGIGTSAGYFETHTPPTLASQGIDKNLAHQARTLGGLSEEQFEQRVAEAREDITHPYYERETLHPNAPKPLRKKARRTLRQEWGRRLADLPKSLEGARRFYLERAAAPGVDLDQELRLIVDGLQRIAGERAAKPNGHKAEVDA
jgi:hypothetical protein